MKFNLFLSVLLTSQVSNALAECPNETALASEVLNAFISGATLNTETCTLPGSSIKIPRPFDEAAKKPVEACDENPYKIVEVKKIDDEVFEAKFQFNVKKAKKNCALGSSDTFTFRRYSGELRTSMESCVGILSLPKVMALKSACLPK